MRDAPAHVLSTSPVHAAAFRGSHDMRGCNNCKASRAPAAPFSPADRSQFEDGPMKKKKTPPASNKRKCVYTTACPLCANRAKTENGNPEARTPARTRRPKQDVYASGDSGPALWCRVTEGSTRFASKGNAAARARGI
ncbi:hypothetical protein HPB50_024560 [Hyalomma asiaticum]|uniref:Uncharacterized protein n=1 Tax=Hyalomma asiaticum TaxID=266040 RepID=A0ACB7TSS6_HYAAI|nr:hypothetical protein HPB50_024560 [Hyalomma asiaticum]